MPDNNPKPAVDPVVRSDSDTDDSLQPKLAHLGTFELRREIGRGGMGTVYEAWCSSRKKLVALKVLAHHVSASQQAIIRFKREAQAAARLQHDHITPIYEQGQEKNVYYYAMELLCGPSLIEVIRAQRLQLVTGDETVDLAETIVLPRNQDSSPSDHTKSADESQATPPKDSTTATTISLPREFLLPGKARYIAIAKHMASIASALDYAHGQGIIHRDIKPHNLILGDDHRLRVTDFGLARVAHEPGVTMTGEMLGSPLYMSPEQIVQGPIKVDHRTDIYSLGVTMYEWLTLTPPYPGDTRERVISLIVNGEPKSPREHNPEIPADLETICLKAIAHDQSRRYESAGEFRDDLHRFMADKPIRARRAGLLERARKFTRKHQLGVLAACAAVVALSLTWALFSMKTEVQSTQQEMQRVVARERVAKEQSERAMSLVTKMLPPEIAAPISVVGAALEGVSNLVAATQNSADQNAAAITPAPLGTPGGVAQRAAMDFYEEIVFPKHQVSLHSSTGINDAFAKAALVRRSDMSTSLTKADTLLTIEPTHVPTLFLRSVLLVQAGQAQRVLDDVHHLAELANGPAVYILSGIAHLLAGEFEESLSSFAQAENDPLTGAWSSALRALALMQMGRVAAALTEADRALDSRPTLATALLARAMAYGATGNAAAAIIDLTSLLEQEPDNADILSSRGQNYVATGEYAKAIDDYERSIKIGGPSPGLSFQLEWIKLMLSRQQSAAAQTAEVAAESDEATPKTTPQITPDDEWNQRVQEAFSRALWPWAPGGPKPQTPPSTSDRSSSLDLGRLLPGR